MADAQRDLDGVARRIELEIRERGDVSLEEKNYLGSTRPRYTRSPARWCSSS